MSAAGAAMLIAATLLSCLGFSSPSSATTRLDKAIYGYSTMPYWVVGTYNKPLSRACQKRQFGQRRQLRYIIGFVGNKGRAITGIASSTWNLYDPYGMAQPEKIYHFFNDGYSDCAVYVATQPKK